MIINTDGGIDLYPHLNLNILKQKHLCSIIMHIFTYPLAQKGCDIRTILKWCLTGLNSKIFWGCLTKIKEPSYSIIYSRLEGEYVDSYEY